MRSAVRFIAALAIAIVMVPATRADETLNPEGKGAKDKVASSAPLATIATVRPSAKGLSAPSATSRPSQGTRSRPAGSSHRWDWSDGSTPRVEWFLGYVRCPLTRLTAWAICMEAAPHLHLTSTGT
jgi:hypothetical protein